MTPTSREVGAMRAVLSLVCARALAGAGRWLLTALGVAVAVAVPVLTAAGTLVATTGALTHGVQGLPAGERTITVSYNGFLTADQLDDTDRVVRKQLGSLSGPAPLRELVFRRLSDGAGTQVALGATDALRRATRLVGGHWPSSCSPTRCEVVQVGTGPAVRPKGLGVLVVGRVARRDPRLLSGTFDPGRDAPLLLGADTAALARSEVLTLFQRSWGWVVPVDTARVSEVGVDRYLARSSEVGRRLDAAVTGLVVTAPDDVLRTQDDRARRSGRRFALLGGTGAVLLLGLVLVGAVSGRRDHLAVVRVLRSRGASGISLGTLTAVESLAPVLLGTVVGTASAGGAVARGLGADQAGRAVTSALPSVGLLVVLAAATVALALRWVPRAGDRVAWQSVTTAAFVTGASGLLAASRGATASTTSDPLVSLLPLLTTLTGALVAARLWPLVPGLVSRLVPRGSAGVRLVLADAGRRPLRAAATAAVVAATTASVVFAVGYRDTLDRGAADQAAYSVPMTARLTTGASLDRPADLLAPGVSTAARALPSGTTAYAVLRAAGSVSLSAADSEAVALVGVDPASLERVARWRPDYADVSATTLARRLRVPPTPRGLALPEDARSLAVPVTGSTSVLEVVALVRDASGRSLPVQFSRAGDVLRADLPAGVSRTLDALGVREDTQTASLRLHAVGEGGVEAPARSGRLVLGAPTVSASPVAASIGTGSPVAGSLASWVASSPSTATGDGDTVTLDYRITGGTVTLTSRVAVRAGASAATAVPAYVDNATARLAQGGLLSVSIGAGQRLAMRVVAAGDAFPTTRGRFAVVDRTALAAALDTVTAGSGSATEVWLAAAPGTATTTLTARVRQPPYDRLVVALRARQESDLRLDPVARTASSLLLGSAGTGLLVGALCVLLLALAERRESGGELFAREADGTRPGPLRLTLLARALGVLLLGIPVGLVTGIVLTRATTTLVAVTAGGVTPVPPLLAATSPGLVAAAVVGVLGAGLVGAALVAMTSLRGPLPTPPPTDLR